MNATATLEAQSQTRTDGFETHRKLESLMDEVVSGIFNAARIGSSEAHLSKIGENLLDERGIFDHGEDTHGRGHLKTWDGIRTQCRVYIGKNTRNKITGITYWADPDVKLGEKAPSGARNNIVTVVLRPKLDGVAGMRVSSRFLIHSKGLVALDSLPDLSSGLSKQFAAYNTLDQTIFGGMAAAGSATERMRPITSSMTASSLSEDISYHLYKGEAHIAGQNLGYSMKDAKWLQPAINHDNDRTLAEMVGDKASLVVCVPMPVKIRRAEMVYRESLPPVVFKAGIACRL